MDAYLFYSSKCNNSINFWNLLEQNGLLNQFTKISIDKMDKRSIKNLNISLIPAILLMYKNGANEIYEGSDCFKWLTKLIQNKRKCTMDIANNKRQEILENNIKNNSGNDMIIDFQPSEMTGISDDYSYIVTDIAQPKNYIQCGNEDKYNIATFNMNNEKLSQHDIAVDIEYKKQIRQQQDVDLNQNIQRKHIEVMLDNTMNN